MAVTAFRTEDLPVSERFGAVHDMTADALISAVISSDHQDDFRATLQVLDLGAVRVSAMTYPSLNASRTPKLIRRSDPEQYQFSLTLRGAQQVRQVGRDTLLGPCDLTFYDSSRPFFGQITAGEGGAVAGMVAQVPKALLPLPLNRVDRLLAVPMSGREGIGSLLMRFLTGTIENAGRLRLPDAPRLGAVLLDLVVALLAHELDAGSAVPPETHRRALMLRIRAFIRQHIGDTRLTPVLVAAAHP